MDSKISWTRINNDSNGNPRYVCHFLDLLSDYEKENLPFDAKYPFALARAHKLGGRKFHNKQYGGGIVFSTYGLLDLEKRIKSSVENGE